MAWEDGFQHMAIKDLPSKIWSHISLLENLHCSRTQMKKALILRVVQMQSRPEKAVLL